MTRHAVLFPLLLLAAAAQDKLPAPSASPLQNDDQKSPQFVTQVGNPAVTAAAGKPARVALRFHVADGNHINSNRPGSELLIPTKLRVMPPTDVGIGQIQYPAGHDLTFTFAPDEKLNVYTGDFAITAKVSAQRTAAVGDYRVHGELRYQACNDRACYPPKTLPVTFDLKLTRTSLRDPNAPKTPPRKNPPQSPHIHR